MYYLLIFLVLLLSGCQTTRDHDVAHRLPMKNGAYTGTNKTQTSTYNRYKYANHRYLQQQDKAPATTKFVSFKEPTPTKEPLSRYGNPSDYKVDGRRYQVLKNSTGYKSRGIASWYATKFHKHRTSSGEPYNMYVMSAAHRTLPLPTYIKVKNLNNGREAIVKVNDRGPFHSNRLIDLSYAAAVKLGIYPHGTAPVEIETLLGPNTKGYYYVQAGAFNTKASANQLRNTVLKMTASPVHVEHYQKHYVVRVGPFADKSLVDSLKQRLTRNGVRGAFSVLI